jgi:hypothetical protein
MRRVLKGHGLTRFPDRPRPSAGASRLPDGIVDSGRTRPDSGMDGEDGQGQKAWRILAIGAGLDIQERRVGQRLRARHWQAHPFWQLCWLCAWVPIVYAAGVLIERFDSAQWEPFIWSWVPLRINGPKIADYLGGAATVLAVAHLYRTVIRLPEPPAT